jgi:S1-C subfamily serine protease
MNFRLYKVRRALRGWRAARWCLAAVVVSAACVAPAAAVADVQPQTTPTALERASAIVQPSVAYLHIAYASAVYDTYSKTYLNTGKPLEVNFSCSGFFVNPDGWVATAGHCVAYDDEVKAALKQVAAQWAYENDYYAGGTFSLDEITQYAEENYAPRGPRDFKVNVSWGVGASGLGQPRTLPAQVVGFKAFEKGDVALLKIEATDLPALKLNDDSTVDVGEQIVSVGFPASVAYVTDSTTFDPSFKDGSVSSKKTIGGGLVSVYEVSAAVSGGMSGGPTIDTAGDVIGINSFGINGETQPFNFAMPAAQMLALLRDKGVPNEIGHATELYREGLEAYWSGHKTEALDKFDEALELSPSFASAQLYRSRAAQLPNEKTGLTWLWVAMGVASVLSAAVATVLLARRRRIRAQGIVMSQPIAVSSDSH